MRTAFADTHDLLPIRTPTNESVVRTAAIRAIDTFIQYNHTCPFSFA